MSDCILLDQKRPTLIVVITLNVVIRKAGRLTTEKSDAGQ